MAQAVPSILLYGQAIKLVEDLKDAQSEGLLQDTGDMIHKLAEILTRFENSAGTPLVNYDPVVETEPPSSVKINKMWVAMERDVNILQQQMDVLKASAVFSHNLVATEILKAKASNARVDNKLKTLQLYSDSADSKTITYGDSFRTFEFIDNSRVPDSERALLAGEGCVTLSRTGDVIDLSTDSIIRILDSSNGFLGNNQEIEDPTTSPKDPDTGAIYYTFKSENKTYADLAGLTDQEPNTWIEYESYLLSDEDRRTANNLNFIYSRIKTDGTVENLDWSKGPSNNKLTLFLELDMRQIKSINYIEYSPYGLENNANFPVFIKQVQTSTNTTDWQNVLPGNVWLGTETNLAAARTADNITTGKAIWSFEARPARYVRLTIEQPNPINTRVGHAYYLTAKGERIEGPIPPLSDPEKYKDDAARGEIVQRREYFDGKRWAIGIRDILMQQLEYTTTSSIVTQLLRVPGVVDRVVLDKASVYVPPEYDSDTSWVNFFVSPDDGINWFQISRIEDNFQNIPEQIAFNDPIPEEFQEAGVAYYNVDTVVTSLRLKIEISRPDDLASTTPILRSYALKVRTQ